MNGSTTGTFTFLFTDVEGSTALWERHPDDMSAAIARHDALIAEAVATCGGVVVKERGQGDSAFAVFTTPSEALRSAPDLQRALNAEAWPEATPIKVRIAIHTGEAEVRDGDYFGPALNRTARILGLAHGGQTVVSSATAMLVADRPPAGVSLRDLGEHALRDLTTTERVYQLVAWDLDAEFPPLRSLSTFRHNLPLQRTSFVGREHELEQTTTLLASVRLLTLVGVGGTGKTRLAIQAAASTMDAFPDGVFFCDLAPIRDPAAVPRAVADTVGALDPLVGSETDDVAGAIQRHLAQTLSSAVELIVLDNCEHLLDRCALLSDVILGSCPTVRILATSREPLGVAGEHVLRVPPLSAPVSWDENDPSSLLESEAVQLFCDRARAVRSDFVLGPQNGSAVAQICHRVEGIPLALELAAARLNALSAQQIADRLEDAFSLLTSGGRTALERHQTLAAAMDWSYDLLSENERVLLRRLAVFVGGWTLEAAERVCGTDPLDVSIVLDVLGRLVDKSFVLTDEVDGRRRYRLLEPIRQFAQAKLEAAAEEEAVRIAHRDHFVDFARDAGFAVQVNYARLPDAAAEVDNLRAAMDFSVEQGETLPALRLAASTHSVWRALGRQRETVPLFRRVLAVAGDHPSTMTATVFGLLASSLEDAGELREAEQAYGRATEMMRMRENELGTAMTRMGGARIYYFRAQYDEMDSAYDEAAALMRSTGVGLAWVLFNHAWMLFSAGRTDRALASAREALAVAADTEKEPIAGARMLVALDIAMSGDLEAGRREATVAMDIAESANPVIAQWLAMILGACEAGLPGGDAAARRYLRRALELARGQSLLITIPWILEFVAHVAVADGALREGARLFGAADTYFDRFGVTARWEPFRAGVDAARQRSSAELGSAYEAETRAGAMLTLSGAVDFATETLDRGGPTSAADIDVRPSFRREGDVRAVAYAGKTVRIRETKGLAYVAQLLANPGRELHVLDLVALVEGHTGSSRASDHADGFGFGDAGEALDPVAKKAYRERLDELRSELDEARSWNDDVRASKAQAEIDALTAELSRAVGLGGRDVRAASAAERARSAVTKAIRAALGKIAREHPELGAHLEGTVKTGIFCTYAPDPRVPISWSV